MDDHAAELRALGRRKARLSTALTAAMVVVYFGFTLLVAYGKAWLGVEIVPGLSRGILLGAATIVVAWLLTFVYVQWTNRVYDPAIHRLRGETTR